MTLDPADYNFPQIQKHLIHDYTPAHRLLQVSGTATLGIITPLILVVLCLTIVGCTLRYFHGAKNRLKERFAPLLAYFDPSAAQDIAHQNDIRDAIYLASTTRRTTPAPSIEDPQDQQTGPRTISIRLISIG